MVTKTLTIMEDAYKMLKVAKRGEESFSDTIRRLCNGKKKNIMDFCGILSYEEGERMQKELEEFREQDAQLVAERWKDEDA